VPQFVFFIVWIKQPGSSVRWMSSVQLLRSKSSCTAADGTWKTFQSVLRKWMFTLSILAQYAGI